MLAGIRICFLFLYILSITSGKYLSPKLKSFVSETITSLDKRYNFTSFIVISKNKTSFPNSLESYHKPLTIVNFSKINKCIYERNSLVILFLFSNTSTSEFQNFEDNSINKVKSIIVYLTDFVKNFINDEFMNYFYQNRLNNNFIISENNSDIYCGFLKTWKLKSFYYFNNISVDKWFPSIFKTSFLKLDLPKTLIFHEHLNSIQAFMEFLENYLNLFYGERSFIRNIFSMN